MKGFMLKALRLDYLKATMLVLATLQRAGIRAQNTQVPTRCFYLSIIENTMLHLSGLVEKNSHAKQALCTNRMLEALKKCFTEKDAENLMVLQFFYPLSCIFPSWLHAIGKKALSVPAKRVH